MKRSSRRLRDSTGQRLLLSSDDPNLVVDCKRCHRKLTKHRDRTIGYGPKCLMKLTYREALEALSKLHDRKESQ